MFPSYRNQLTGFYMMGILTVKGLTLTFRTVKNLCPDLQKPPFKIPGYAPGFETFSHSQEHEKIFMQENCIPSSENLYNFYNSYNSIVPCVHEMTIHFKHPEACAAYVAHAMC